MRTPCMSLEVVVVTRDTSVDDRTTILRCDDDVDDEERRRPHRDTACSNVTVPFRHQVGNDDDRGAAMGGKRGLSVCHSAPHYFPFPDDRSHHSWWVVVRYERIGGTSAGFSGDVRRGQA